MTFEDRWQSIWKQSGLPNTAREQIPACLSEKMKRKIAALKLIDEEIGRLFGEAVDKKNHGSMAEIKELLLHIMKK